MSANPGLLEDFETTTYETWREQVEKDLKGAPFEKKLVTHTYEGIDIQPVYVQGDWDAEGDPSGFPGLFPLTRGADPLGSTACGWDIRQEHTHPDLGASHRLILEDLRRGVTSLQLRYDAAARFGLDADHPSASGLSAKDGLPVYSLADLRLLLADVQLGMIQVGLEAGAAVIPASAQLINLLKEQGVDFAKARGSLNADPLAVLARRGEYPISIEAGIKQAADLAVWTNQNLPHYTAIRVGTGPYHHAGATAAQDLGLSMATALTYLRAMIDAGLSGEQAAKQILFAYSLGTNFFLAISKLRAARRMWAMVLEEAGINAKACPMLMHVRPSKRVLTQRDPYVNMLRNTVCCFAGATAGAQIITTEPFDKALGPAEDFSRRIARNTQLILNQESHLGRVIDPAGGSWFVESLTDELCKKAWGELQVVESKGGMARALVDGYIASSIDSAFKPRLANIAKRKDAVTGVSEFPNLVEQQVERVELDLSKIRAETIRCVKHTRSQTDASVLNEVAERASAQKQDGGLTASVIEAVQAGALVGQIGTAMHGLSENQMIPPLAPHPYAEPFEKLRDASDQYLAMTGNRPSVCLINLGPIAHHTARASFSKNFFEAGGIEIKPSQPLLGDAGEMAQAAVDEFIASGSTIACVCSSDKIYETAAAAVATALKKTGARTVILAGHPGNHVETYSNAGFDRFIFMRCDVLGTLTELLTEEGVL